MKKCVAYLRYSTAKQNITSFDIQTKEIIKYCRRNNLLLLKDFKDAAYSGRDANRPAFQEMIAEAKTHPEWEIVLLYNLSRFARNEEDAKNYKALLRNMGIAVISVTEPCTEEDPDGFMETVLNNLNANELIEKSGASYAGLKLISEKCRHCGGKPPLGYDVDKATGLLVVNAYEAQLVKAIFEMYNTGYSYSKMADYLNGIGAKTKAGNSFSEKSFHDILTQPKYIGTFSWGKCSGKSSYTDASYGYNLPEAQTIVQNGCPAIISRQLFADVQERMTDTDCGNRDSKSQNHYMLSGLRILKCGCCSRYLTGKSYSSKGYKYVKYTCPDKKCINKPITTKDLDNCVANILLDKFFLTQSRDTLNALINSTHNPDLLKLYEDKLRGVKMKQNNLIELISEVPSDKAIEKLKALDKEKTALEEKIAKQQATLPQLPANSDTEGMEKLCEAIREELINSDEPAIKLFIKSAVKEVVLNPADVSITLAQPPCENT